MQVLTPTGYVDINDLNIGDEVLAYDINDGHLFTNILEGKTQWTPTMFPPEPPVYEVDEEGNIVYDEDGNPIILEPGKTSEQVFQETYGDWKFYKVNNTWTLFCNQSIWANMNVTHASQLQVGDVIYNDQDQDVVITSIEEVEAPNWWRLDISGDHSFIADGLTLHNASRYWVGGGANSNWNATANTNWGSTSGGANNASVPTSADDVIFDGAGVNGNTNSTISATIAVLSLNITTGYTATMTHNATLTLSSNWTFRSTYTIAGTGAVTFNGSATITSNGATWPNALNFTLSITVTLSGNLSVNGLVSFVNTTTLNATTTESITCAGGITNGFIAGGTAKIILTGGTWTDTQNYGFNNPIDINGNVTISGVVRYGYSGTANTVLTYVSGTVTTTGSTLVITGNCTLNTNGITWNNVSTANSTLTISLASNFLMSGLMTASVSTTINTSNSSTFTTSGGLAVNNTLQGTAKVILTGGTWSGTSALSNNLDISGNITVSGTVTYSGANFTYVSGTLTTTGSTIDFRAATTITSNGSSWNNITFSVTGTKTLVGNLTVNGVFTVAANIATNRTTTERVLANGGFTVSGAASGTAEIYLQGGTWSRTTGVSVNLPIVFNGNVTVSGTLDYALNTMTYLSGTITTTGSTLNFGQASVLNTNGITWNNVAFTGVNYTLTSNFLVGGILNIAGSSIVATSNSSTLTAAGGITVNNTLSGTAKVILTGGTWSSNGSGITSNLDIAGNVTVSGTVLKTGGTLTYVSGTVTVTGSTINFQNSCTVSTGGMVWNNLGNNSSTTVTLTSNLFIGGSFSTTGGTVPTIAFNRTSTEFIYVSGGMSIGGAVLGTADVYLTGGTWTASTFINNNLFIQGNVTVSGNVYYRIGTLKYVSGTVTTTGSTLHVLSNLNIDTAGMVWANLNNSFSATTITLLSNFVMTGLLTTGNANSGLIINTSVGSTFTVGGGITVIRTLAGTAKVILTGGTWSSDGSAITNNFDIAGSVTISGAVAYGTNTLTYVSGTVTTTGSTLNIPSNCTLNTSGIAWNNITTPNSSSPTITLTSNLTLNGLLSISNGAALYTTINRTTTETVTLNGGVYLLSARLRGTAELLLNGGTWSTNLSNATQILSQLTINGNVTISGDVYFSSNTLTYVSGTVTATGSRLLLEGVITLNTNGITWNNVVFFAPNVTLTSNFTMTGLLDIRNNGQCRIDTSVGATWTTAGGVTLAASITLSGTAKVILTGGAWNGGNGQAYILNNIDIDGNVTIGASACKSGGVITYISGYVNARSGTLNTTGSVTFNTNGIEWGGIISTVTTITLTSNFTMLGRLFINASATTINKTTSETFTIKGELYIGSGLQGSADIYLSGAWFGIGYGVSNNIYIDGDLRITSDVYYYGALLVYLKGKVDIVSGNLNLGGGTLIGFNKCPLSRVVVMSSSSISMDQFFVGTPSRACAVSGTNSFISFTNGFEKIARYVTLTGITITRNQQLLIISNNRFNTNRDTNSPRIRYTNQSPNGVPKNTPSILDTMTVPALGLVNDPCFQYS